MSSAADPLRVSRARLRGRYLLLVVAALGALGAALVVTKHLQTVETAADHQSHVALELQGALEEANALEWETIATGSVTAELQAELDDNRRDLELLLDELTHTGSQSFGAHMNEDFATYLTAVDEEVRLVLAGDLEAAEKLDESVIDPTFDSLRESLHAEVLRLTAEADAADRWLLRSIWLIVGAIAITLTTLFALFDRIRAHHRRVEAEHSALRRLAEERRRDSLQDELTRLPNRRALLERLDEMIADATPDRALSLMIMDLDGFKELNDSLGHAAGDRMLVELATRLVDGLGDCPEMIARLGGDEFAIVIVDRGDDDIRRCAETTTSLVSEQFVVDGIELHLGASVGIAHFPDDGHTREALMHCADVAMYAAKSGLSPFERYRSEMEHYSRDSLQLTSELRAAIADRQLTVHFQPVYDLRSDSMTGVEALVRWNHPVHGMLPPGQFLELAQHARLMHPLTMLVLEQSIAQCAIWSGRMPAFEVAVNLAPTMLFDVTLADDIHAVLEHHRLPAHLLTLEITEEAILSERAVDTVAALVELGVKLSIDDFGTGYSSLGHLKKLPITQLKIDRSFISQLESDDEGQAIVRAIIALADALQLDTVAEGIETVAVRDLLRDFGCAQAQGFLMSRPVPAHAIDAMIAEQAAIPSTRPALAVAF
jgi:diguanylate cyclase